MPAKKAVIFIMGPTATGKTGLSIELAKEFNFEIINADSTLVYRGMDIGTAKPTHKERQGVPHHLIDIREPSQSYSVGEFCADALRLIPEIQARAKIPCLVGGTMLYFHYLEKGQLGMPASQPLIREAIEIQGANLGWPAMWEILRQKDPQRASELHRNDRQRIARALELAMLLEQNPKAITQHQPLLSDLYDLTIICLEAKNRSWLHLRIAERFQKMLADGLIEEARRLYADKNNDPSLPAMRTVGYRQAKNYLDGNWSLAEFSDKTIAATRQLAKRQHTWLNKWSPDCRVDCLTANVFELVANKIRLSLSR